MENFTPIASLSGGVLIGASAAAMLLLNGRIAGVSGILAGAILPTKGDTLWRGLFLAGMIAGGLALHAVRPEAYELLDRPLAPVVLAGLLVGFGTRLGSGCTSGHGVCGMSRLSPRSIVATLTFMATGAATVFVVRHVIGGAP